MPGRDGQSKTAQDDALDKALIMLGEHFDNVTIVCDAPDVEFPDDDHPSLFFRRKGSTWSAIGLMKAFQAILMKNFLADEEE